MPESEIATPLSIYSIAEILGYTPAGVHRAIERIGIKPEQITPGGVRYFSPLAVDKLRDHMRRPPRSDSE